MKNKHIKKQLTEGVYKDIILESLYGSESTPSIVGSSVGMEEEEREHKSNPLLPTSHIPSENDHLLDDATELLMMVSGRIMSAKDVSVSPEILQQAVHHIEQADGILAKAGLTAHTELSEMSSFSDVPPGDTWRNMMKVQELQKLLDTTMASKRKLLDSKVLSQVAELLQAAIKILRN